MNDRKFTFKLRPDVTIEPTAIAGEQTWIVHDPFGSNYLYVNKVEFEILRLANGVRSIPQIIQIARERFSDYDLPDRAVVAFLADARREGVLSGPIVDLSIPKSMSLNPMAIRLPGISVDCIVKPVVNLMNVLSSKMPLLQFAAVVFAVALVTVACQYSFIANHIAALSNRPLSAWGVSLFVVILLTKIVHEISHAVACTWFGRECRQIGVMLLFGFPVLYCDVSDAWLLTERWKRITVSAAGMLAELFLAAIATIAWVCLDDSLVRDLCVMVMVVCSLSTIVINGNPLLRYDGYYILSDWFDVPNLAGRAFMSTRNICRRFVWGLEHDCPLTSSDFWLALYCVFSLVYRIFVLLAITVFLSRTAIQLHFGGLATLLLALAFSWMAFRTLCPVLLPISTTDWFDITLDRKMFLAILTGIFILTIAFFPLPRLAVAPAMIQPSGAQDVYVAAPGRITWSVRPGQYVHAGDLVASLRNHDLEMKVIKLQTELVELQSSLERMKRQRNIKNEISKQIRSTQEMIASTENRLDLARKNIEKLAIIAPDSGQIYDTNYRAQQKVEPREMTSWIGSSLSMSNHDRYYGAWLESGTSICSIGHPKQYDAIAIVSEQTIALIEEGQEVFVQLPNHPKSSVKGEVIEISLTPLTEIPQRYTEKGYFNSTINDASVQSYYQVRVSLDDSVGAILIQQTCHCSIRVKGRSLGSRLLEGIRRAFL